MKITLDIPENQASFFIELLGKLGFTKFVNKEEEDLSEAQCYLLDERSERLTSGKGKVRPWADFRKELG